MVCIHHYTTYKNVNIDPQYAKLSRYMIDLLISTDRQCNVITGKYLYTMPNNTITISIRGYVCMYIRVQQRQSNNTTCTTLHYTTLTPKYAEREVREKLHVKTDRESERERKTCYVKYDHLSQYTHYNIHSHTNREILHITRQRIKWSINMTINDTDSDELGIELATRIQ